MWDGDKTLAILVVLFTSIGILMFFGGRFLDGANSNRRANNRQIGKSKKVFPLPPLKNVELANRLGVTRDDGAIVTVSIQRDDDNFGDCMLVITNLIEICNLFILFDASNEEDETYITEKVKSINGFAIHRLLFHQSAIGKVAIIRQMKPQLHIEYDANICQQVAPHIRKIIQITNNRGGSIVKNNNWTLVENIRDILTIKLSPSTSK